MKSSFENLIPHPHDKRAKRGYVRMNSLDLSLEGFDHKTARVCGAYVRISSEQRLHLSSQNRMIIGLINKYENNDDVQGELVLSVRPVYEYNLDDS